MNAFQILTLSFALIALPILACGGSSAAVLPAGTFAPEQMAITGLPQFVAPSASPPPTHTQAPTSFAPPINVPASGYATYTPYPGSIYVCPSICYMATYTAYPGGKYLYPAYTILPSSSTPRPSYTPWPSPTACTSMNYYFDEEVYTDAAPDSLNLALALGNVRRYNSSLYPQKQVVVYQVEIRNLGSLDYLLFAPFQIYVAEVAEQNGAWYASEAAAQDLGSSPAPESLEALIVEAGMSVSFDLYAYSPAGEVGALAWILNPYANGYDGSIGGGNLAYWRSGNRGACAGRILGTFTPAPNRSAQPSPTVTRTPNSCAAVDPVNCVTVVPGG